MSRYCWSTGGKRFDKFKLYLCNKTHIILFIGYIDFQEDDVDGKSRSISRSQPSVVRSPTNGIRSPSSPPPYTDRRMDQGNKYLELEQQKYFYA